MEVMKEDIMKSKYINGGEIFCIPLFWTNIKYDPKNKLKLKKEDENKEFAFGRAISDEKGCGILVEIFKIIGSININYEKIIHSGRLFGPIFIFWAGIKEKRWKVIHQTPNYDKYKDSNYGSIEIIFGSYDNLYLENISTHERKKIKEDEISKYEQSIVWHPIQLEKRIVSIIKI
jgi:hypothetical protein